ncbi:hypothetical protein [Saccharibacillus alkalitolerans]|uniref:Uncharacterized protein n=1 Tax=Saccharibacillus alkalitolerans TaxID=2705290 RepID=A0ABX0F2C6_9BACL|nr:hypothetical protein [Saccharibacillus alkalitolerans]NGZ74575.1 hypothetical protein [Saccharibacillus alkalitolerans]
MDKKAKKILNATFWSSKGWKNAPAAYSGEDFEYAKARGVMFDPLTVTHDELVARIRGLHESGEVTKEKAAAAFLHSLSTRRVELRSALSSYALTADLPVHGYTEHLPQAARRTSACPECDGAGLQSSRDYANFDLNVLNFERVKWGGVRHNWLPYCWMDLDLLAKSEIGEPAKEDVDILRAMLQAVDDCEPHEHARKLETRWKDRLPSNRAERDTIMEIWAYAGILAEKDTPRLGRRGDTDFMAVEGWQGDDGYSREALLRFFGAWL